MITVVDPIVRFHNLITVPQRDLVDTGQSAQAWQRSRPTFVAGVLGPHFEQCARDWLRGRAEFRGEAGLVAATAVNDRKGRADAARRRGDVLLVGVPTLVEGADPVVVPRRIL
ncbi:hypothetical protein AB0M50_37335 [Nonomuraea fuscirosea]|uniref:hypothetical protein n=1 Tax=Nonomuraea fuscirosea TaxID=1291556 RepID=UPI00342EFA65